MSTSFLMRLLLICTLLCFPCTAGADPADGRPLTEQQLNWLEENPHSLPIWMTPEEEARKDEIGSGFRGTPPPPADVRMPAEFEPVTGVMIRWPLGIPYDLIAEMSEDVEVWTIVGSASQQTSAESAYSSNGVNMANCHFFIAGTDSYWTRDYGPWYVFTGNDEQGIVDVVYNRPRPNDDDIPTEWGVYLGVPVYGSDLIATGGNWMCDGLGVGMSTRLTLDENPGMSEAEIDQNLLDYCGITEYHPLPYTESGGIHHLDCTKKFLDVDTILVEEKTPTDPELEANVAFLETLTSSWGTPYEVIRVPVGNGNTEAYTNSLILNTKVLVPTFGTSNDAVALAIYESAMPGYEVIGFDGSWLSDDAIHCRAKGIVDRQMLFIDHTPLIDPQTAGGSYTVAAEIHAYSGQPLSTGFPQLRYSINGGLFNSVTMTNTGGDTWQGSIPAQADGAAVDYYIHAEDDSGRAENHPYIGAQGAHDFTVSSTGDYPVIGHTALGDQSLGGWPATVTATVTDADGLSEVVLEYSVNSVPQTEVAMVNTGGNSWEGVFAASVSDGDMVDYRIRAVDASGSSNTSHDPAAGYHGFSIISSVPVYVWNPSGSASGAAFATALDSLGIAYASGSALPGDPAVYESIFVCLGIYSSNHVLTSGEGSTLAAYLDGGGRLYMEGGDTWAYNTATAVHPYFHINGDDDGSGDCGPVNGAAGTFTEGMSFSYSGVNAYIDHISPGGGAVTVFSNGSPAYDNGIAYDGTSYLTVGCSFEFAGLDDGASPSTKEELLSGLLDYFGVGQSQPVDTVSASLGCTPSSGILPFTFNISCGLTNLVDESRQAAARLEVTVAGGSTYPYFRGGYTNLAPQEVFTVGWNQNLPGVSALVGDNLFRLVAEDVTPPPYNQPPFLPAGDTDSASCSVTGNAP